MSCKDEYGPPLWTASYYGLAEIVRKLLAAGAHVDAANDNGNTPLIAAASEGHLDIVKALVDAGANLHRKNDDGKTALWEASYYAYTQIVRELLAAGAHVDAADNDGGTPLIAAALRGHLDTVKALVDAGVNLQQKNNHGKTALYKASFKGHTQIVRELLAAGAHVDTANICGRTPLISAANNGHLDTVKALGDAGANFQHKCGLGKTALDRAKANNHQEVVAYLSQARQVSRPTSMPPVGPSAPPIPTTSPTRQVTNPVASTPTHPASVLSELWTSAVNGSLTEQSVANFLISPDVSSIQMLIIAHNILLLAIRQQVITLDNLKSFPDDPDYVATKVYLPLRGFMNTLDDYEKVVCKYVLHHAQRIGLIEKHHVFAIKLNADAYGEIHRSRKQVSMVVEKVVRQLQDFDNRVNALAQWSTRATEEIRRICEHNQCMVGDILKLGNSLDNLHEVLRKSQRRKMYAGIAGLLLSFIPVVGGALSTGASASADILLGMNQAGLLEVGSEAAKGAVNHFLSVDLSNFRSVGILTSEHFMISLDEPTKKRVVAAIKHSEFGSVENFRKEFAEAQKVMMELEETSEIDEGVESELTKRFGLITVESTDGTATIRDAALELCTFCARRLPKFDVSQRDVKRELLKHCNEVARLDYEGFQEAFRLFDEKYGISGSENKVTSELEERFSKAAQRRNSIDLDSAMFVLKRLYDNSAEGDANVVSFTRSGDEWDYNVVEKLFEEQGNANGNITKEGFIRVGLEVLFKEG